MSTDPRATEPPPSCTHPLLLLLCKSTHQPASSQPQGGWREGLLKTARAGGTGGGGLEPILLRTNPPPVCRKFGEGGDKDREASVWVCPGNGHRKSQGGAVLRWSWGELDNNFQFLLALSPPCSGTKQNYMAYRQGTSKREGAQSVNKSSTHQFIQEPPPRQHPNRVKNA